MDYIISWDILRSSTSYSKEREDKECADIEWDNNPEFCNPTDISRSNWAKRSTNNKKNKKRKQNAHIDNEIDREERADERRIRNNNNNTREIMIISSDEETSDSSSDSDDLLVEDYGSVADDDNSSADNDDCALEAAVDFDTENGSSENMTLNYINAL